MRENYFHVNLNINNQSRSNSSYKKVNSGRNLKINDVIYLRK